MVAGFEDVWRPVALNRRSPRPVLSPPPADTNPRARLRRLAARAPEVMVKVTGRTRDPGHLRAHLDYITRNGELPLEGPDGVPLQGRVLVRDLAEDWALGAAVDPRRRAGAPLSLSLVLSMPAATDPGVVRDAARAFAVQAFDGTFDYGLVLHTDADHPHVHLAVRRMGWNGERLNPKKADLQAWRELFAQALRDRGVEAEATPRRARGVTRKAERQSVRKMRERAEAGTGPLPRVRRLAYQDAARATFGEAAQAPAWEARSLERQRRTRALYLAQARLLAASPHPQDRMLARNVEAFVTAMPPADSQRLSLARQLRDANERLRSSPPADRGRDRTR
jgi:type IV secretory pathway VirD2 relaxase